MGSGYSNLSENSQYVNIYNVFGPIAVKSTTVLTSVCILLLTLAFGIQSINAEDLSSNTYQIQDFSFGPLGSEETSANNALLLSGAELTRDDRFISTNYSARVGVANTWKASVPKVHCFETVSDGSTTCDDPDITNGMVEICGGGGCYNRARIEIDPSGNPTDTLYSIQITTDPAWSTFQYVDGSSFLLEDVASHDINDYLTETAWEDNASTINIFGLEDATQYYVRLTALHGDFTETEPGPSAIATTAWPQIVVDIDIADNAGSSVESSGPYQVDMGELVFGEISTATDLIWLDVDTNLNEGASVYVRSLNEGLFSSSTGYTLTSSNADLASSAGFGIQNNTATEQFLGGLVVATDYSFGGDIVGGVPDDAYSKKVLTTSSSPVYQGRASFYIKGKPAEQTPSSTDYTDTFIFTVSGDL